MANSFIFAAFLIGLAVCALADVPAWCVSDAHGYQCDGATLKTVAGITTHNDCCTACVAYGDGCRAWTWHYPSQECMLKSTCNNVTSSQEYHTSWPRSPTPSPTPSPGSNPFDGIDSVKVFNPSQASSIQSALNPLLPIPTDVDSDRLAVFLESGDYGNTNLHVGYFTSVSGLGVKPSDVKLGEVKIDTVGSNRGDTTTIFWRSVENMETDMYTWCSQGVAFRRILANHFVHDIGKDAQGRGGGSGGFIADCLVKTSDFHAGGQQYFVRNLKAPSLNKDAWLNTLYVGCEGNKVDEGDPSIAFVDHAPTIAEKPYITKNGTEWSLVKPKLYKDVQGPSFDESGNPVREVGEYIGFSQVFVAKKGTTATEINEQIAKGKHIIMPPYVYRLEDSIRLTRSGTVLLGLGLATLECADGKPCIVIGAVDDVRVAGFTIAGAVNSKNDVWVKIGDSKYKGNADKPSILSDNHIIVGYYRYTSVQTSVEVNNGQVILDHSWSWRSDIDGASGESRNGFTVNGDDVTAYGIFAEHHWQYSLAWYGNNGRNYFFQCETPWDAAKGTLVNWHQARPSASNPWRNWPAPNWYENPTKPRCYYVDDQVNVFFGISIGAYSMEGGGCSTWCGCQATQAMDTHIQISNEPGVSLLNVACWKNCGGGVNHCVNTGTSDLGGGMHTNWCSGKEVIGAPASSCNTSYDFGDFEISPSVIEPPKDLDTVDKAGAAAMAAIVV